MGAMEFLFKSPLLYEIKRNVLFFIGEKLDPHLEDYVADKDVLNLGCGTAMTPISLKKARSVTGIDVSEEFIEKARSRDPQGRYLVADAASLPFEDKSFDVTVSFDVLHHIPKDASIIIDEVLRVTKEKLVLIDRMQSEKGFPRWVKTFWWKISDGGSNYYTKKDWERILKDMDVIEDRISGRLFKNSYLFIGEPKSSSVK